MFYSSIVTRYLKHRGLQIVEDTLLDDIFCVLEAGIRPSVKRRSGASECIVFSKDRALQLHAFLWSFREKVVNPSPVHVLYDVSGPGHQDAYDELFSMCAGNIASAVQSRPFRETLHTLCESLGSENVIFFTDDDMFIEPVDLQEFSRYPAHRYVPSLRLGANLTKCYTRNRPQPLPEFIPDASPGPEVLCWRWRCGEHDWAYPLSVDGHLFSVSEVLAMMTRCEFGTPNSFELALKRFQPAFTYRYGLCYEKSRLMNIPYNRVQTEIDNIHGSVHQDYLLEQWHAGKQIDRQALYGHINASAHEEVPLRLVHRK